MKTHSELINIARANNDIEMEMLLQKTTITAILTYLESIKGDKMVDYMVICEKMAKTISGINHTFERLYSQRNRIMNEYQELITENEANKQTINDLKATIQALSQ